MSQKDFEADFDVSRETSDHLALYLDLLARWNGRINLVGRSTLDDPWRRHVLDSAQLHPLIPRQARVLVDLGSGAGLPGLVLAMLDTANRLDVHLIESDARKCAFLREAARLTGAAVTIHARRLETVTGLTADVVTARALAGLPELLEHAAHFVAPGGTCLFLKGRQSALELQAAVPVGSQRGLQLQISTRPSRSDPSGSIFQIDWLAAPRGVAAAMGES